MDKLNHVLASGLDRLARAQRVHVNNLSNVRTTGFRADMEHFTSAELQGAGHRTRVPVTGHVTLNDFSSGPVVTTGRSLDMAINGEGMFAVLDEAGNEAYTRAGNFKLTPDGRVTTMSGLTVLGDGGALSIPPASKIEIGSDGVISILPQGQEGGALAQIDRIRLVKPDTENLLKGDDGLFRLSGGATAPPDATVSVISGALEGSNVSMIESLVAMIETTRLFSYGLKLMERNEQMDASSARIMQLS